MASRPPRLLSHSRRHLDCRLRSRVRSMSIYSAPEFWTDELSPVQPWRSSLREYTPRRNDRRHSSRRFQLSLRQGSCQRLSSRSFGELMDITRRVGRSRSPSAFRSASRTTSSTAWASPASKVSPPSRVRNMTELTRSIRRLSSIIRDHAAHLAREQRQPPFSPRDVPPRSARRMGPQRS